MCGSTGWWTSIAKRKRILIFISSLDICSCVASGVMDFCPLLWRIWWFSKNNGKLINDSALRILCVVLTYIFAIAIWDYLQHEYLDNLNSFRLDPQAQPSPCIVCMCQGLARGRRTMNIGQQRGCEVRLQLSRRRHGRRILRSATTGMGDARVGAPSAPGALQP
jgi:hypothetical protein